MNNETIPDALRKARQTMTDRETKQTLQAKNKQLQEMEKLHVDQITVMGIQLEEQEEEIKRLKYDLAIVHEHTNLADNNTKKSFMDANRMIRNRTKKYESLRLTAGPLYVEGQEEQDLKENK